MNDWTEWYLEGDTPWDKGAPAPPLAEWLKSAADPAGRVLVPGCGFGHDAAAVARAWPASQVVGLDVAVPAVDGARVRHSLPNLSFVLGDFFQPPSEWRGSFDWIIEHTCVSAIPPDQRDAYVSSAAAVLRSGGRIFAIFFISPWDPDEDQDQGPPFQISETEIDRHFGPRFKTLRSEVPAAAFPGREGRELVRILQLQ